MLMPFGKFRGVDLVDIDLGYLEWAEEHLDINTELRQAINHEIERRKGDRPGMGRVVKKGKL